MARERAVKGEKVFKRLQAGSGLPLMFGWQASDVTLLVPSNAWDRLAKSDKIDLTYYMDTLPSVIRRNPSLYVGPWSAYYKRTEGLERGGEFDGLSRESYLANAGSICSSCWSIATGTLKRDGFYDDDYPVKGSTAESFRR